MKLYNKFLNIIKKGIKEYGITQENLAYELNMYPSQVSLFLNGKSASISVIDKILKYLEDKNVNLTFKDNQFDENKDKLNKIKEILSES